MGAWEPPVPGSGTRFPNENPLMTSRHRTLTRRALDLVAVLAAIIIAAANLENYARRVKLERQIVTWNPG